jgi:phosphoglycerate dehydrogenase-like enzyme
MSVRVLITESEYRKGGSAFEGEIRMECLRAPDEEKAFAAAVRDTQSRHVIVGPLPYTGPLYESLKPGAVIARFGVGHDSIDKQKATAGGILCTNTPGVLQQSVAECTMLMVGAAARHFVTLANNTSRGIWQSIIGIELAGKTVAIIGCGEIGRSTARIASLGYGMRVIGCSRPDAVPPARLEHFHLVTNDFAEAVREADFVSLHLSARPANSGFINRARLAMMKPGAWLINTARGSVVDEAELFAALGDGRLAGAALDVFAREPYEPVRTDADLRTLPNVILTPHVGSHTIEAGRRIGLRALQNIRYAEAREFGRMDLLNREVLARTVPLP